MARKHTLVCHASMARKKQKQSPDEPKKRALYTIKLEDAQMDKLDAWCNKRLWTPFEVDYARFAYKGDDVNVVAYNSGKVVIQGKKTEDFVTYVLEAEITQEPRMGYDEVNHPEWFAPHAGIDESGKGDLFGPLVSACVIAEGEMVRTWVEKGLKETKRVSSDKAVLDFDKMIRGTEGVVVKTTFARMERYNELYRKFGSNLNKLLAWMHAKSIEQALEVKRVERGLIDQFSRQPLVQAYFKDDPIQLDMRPRAEEDPVVAAASIVARAEYIRQMAKLEKRVGEHLMRGASAQTKAQGKRIVEQFGPDALPEFAKMHFRTAYEVLGKEPPAKKFVWRGKRASS